MTGTFLCPYKNCITSKFLARRDGSDIIVGPMRCCCHTQAGLLHLLRRNRVEGTLRPVLSPPWYQMPPHRSVTFGVQKIENLPLLYLGIG
ncbi:unnamed protein product [Danaus chrysippus]|uniref:(African queen) hypothetical protein n=1 Tax=Danaus chrysippus TaxID=151541 RepID=A0A8J2VTH7_9NEOP|nr:unnamed protein product [Danaus chrysippus]